MKIYDRFECENSNSSSRSPTSTNISNFSLPKSIDILKSKFDSNPINLYQHEKLSHITNLDCTKSELPIQTSVSLTPTRQDSEANFLTKPSTVYIKQEIQDENKISTYNPNELPNSKFENSPPITQDCFSVIQQLPDLAYAYDKSHTCSNCVAYYGRPDRYLVYELTYTMNNGQGPILKFFIPQQHITSFDYTPNKVRFIKGLTCKSANTIPIKNSDSKCLNLMLK